MILGGPARSFWIAFAVAVAIVTCIVLAVVLTVRGVNRSGANTIRVVAEDEDAAPLVGATVTATRSSIGGVAKAQVEAAHASGASLTQASGATNARGIWQQKNLASGDWTVQVNRESFQPKSAVVPVSGDKRADQKVVVEGWSVTEAYAALSTAVKSLANGDANLNVSFSFVNSNTTLDAEGRSATAFTDADSSVNEAQFKTEFRAAMQDVRKLLEAAYTTEAGYGGNLSVTVTEITESGSDGLLDDYTASEYGDIRVGVYSTGFPANVLAYTYTPQNAPSLIVGDILFNGGIDWRLDSDVTDGSTGGGYSVRYVAAHEILHAFGLGHHALESSIMFPMANVAHSLTTRFADGLETSKYELNALRGMLQVQ